MAKTFQFDLILAVPGRQGKLCGVAVVVAARAEGYIPGNV
jgi:hypothetical protein